MSAPSGGGGGGGGEAASEEVGSSLAPSSLPPPRPKSPPEYPDLYGKRREAARVQMLEREIGFLEVKYLLNYITILKQSFSFFYFFINLPFLITLRMCPNIFNFITHLFLFVSF